VTARLRSCGLLLAIAWLYLYSFPYFPAIHSANELPRVYLTWSMVEEGSVAIDTPVQRWGTTVDVSPAHGHLYSNKAPGSSMLAVPAYLALKGVKAVLGGEPTLAEMVWTCRVFTGVLPSLLFLILLGRFLGRFGGPDARRLAVVGYALGTMAMTYSVLFIAHQLSAVCIGTAYVLIVRVVEDGRDARWLLAAGAAAGAAPLVDYQAAFAGVPVAVYLVWKLLAARPRRIDVAVRGVLGLFYGAAGAAVPIAVLLLYHWQAFGSPFKTGYDFSQTFAHFHQQGFLGMTELRWEAFVGSTVTPDNGLVFLSPMLLLAVPGWIVLFRRGQRAHLAISLSVAVIYLLFISSINFWRGGWQMGPRYVTAMLPFLMVPVTAALDAASQRWPLRAAGVALVGVSAMVYGVSCALFPHFPEKFTSPLYELVLRLLGDGLSPYNLGWLLGLRGLAALAPYLLVLAGVIVYAAWPERSRWKSALVGLAGAAVILAAYGAAPRGGQAAERAYQWVTTTFPR
jgi:hypothetical protein